MAYHLIILLQLSGIGLVHISVYIAYRINNKVYISAPGIKMHTEHHLKYLAYMLCHSPYNRHYILIPKTAVLVEGYHKMKQLITLTPAIQYLGGIKIPPNISISYTGKPTQPVYAI